MKHINKMLVYVQLKHLCLLVYMKCLYLLRPDAYQTLHFIVKHLIKPKGRIC